MNDLPQASSRQFRFLRCLGLGAFGEVYEAEMQSASGLARRVAIKVLKAELAGDPDAVRRLYDEGMLLARLDHPNILKVIDLVRIGDRRALVMEYIDGADMTQLLRDESIRLPLRVVLEIGAQTARALDAAWSTKLPGSDRPLEILHRDVKPGNIRVSKHGVVKLLDFGVARSDRVEREARTEVAIVVGSVPFMAPETFMQEAPSHPVDTFGLGCVLYEAFTGRRFYQDLTKQRVLQLLAVRSEFETHLDAQLKHIEGPGLLRDTVCRCLAYDARDRLTALELAERLERMAEITRGPTLVDWCRRHEWREPELFEGRLVGQTLTEGTQAKARPPARRNPWIPALGGLVLLGIVGCAGVLGVGTIGSLSTSGAAVERRDPIPVQPVLVAPRPPAPADPAPVPDPVEPVPVEPVPVEPVPVEPNPVEPLLASDLALGQPAVKPAPVAPAPTPSPVAPSPSPPAPTPAPPPNPAPRPTSLVVFFQDAAGKQFGADQDLPPGPYSIMADFGDGLAEVGKAEVKPGEAIQLKCSRSRKTCWTE